MHRHFGLTRYIFNVLVVLLYNNDPATLCAAGSFAVFHQTFVELGGFEPPSSRGTNEFSTCLAANWFSCAGRPVAANRHLSSCGFRKPRGALGFLFPILLHRLIEESRDDDSRAMSRLCNYCGDKADLLYFNQAARA